MVKFLHLIAVVLTTPSVSVSVTRYLQPAKQKPPDYIEGDKEFDGVVNKFEVGQHTFESYGTNRSAQVVACLGDSITKGVCGDNWDSYPQKLQAMLGGNYNVYNYGCPGSGLLYGGKHPIWYEDVLTSAKASKPSILVVMFGTNDAKSTQWNNEDFLHMYKQLLRDFWALESLPKIYIMTPPPVYDSYVNYEMARIVNDKLTPLLTWFAWNNGVNLIDNYATFQAYCPNFYVKDCFMIAGTDCDPYHIHPNAYGYGQIAHNVKNAIR